MLCRPPAGGKCCWVAASQCGRVAAPPRGRTSCRWVLRGCPTLAISVPGTACSMIVLIGRVFQQCGEAPCRTMAPVTISNLRDLGLKLRELWLFHNTPAAEILKFAEVHICVDGGSVDELTDENSLSVGLMNKVNEEIAYLKDSKDVKLKNKYLRKKNKLLKMIEESHLLPSQFDFDPKEQVKSDFAEATTYLKTLIGQVKTESIARKERVMRIEVLLESVDQSLCAKTSERLLRSLKPMVTHEDEFLFDGKDIKVLLSETEIRIKSNSELPAKKRASARLMDQKNNKGDTPELPPLPYPSGIRGGHRTHPNQAWGKGSKK